MFSWATERLEQLAQTVAPPPTDAVGRFLYSVQRNDESVAQGCLTEMMDPIYTVIQPSKGTYPIHLACQHGMERLLRQILAIPGASTEQLDAMGHTSLHYACLNTNSKTALHMVKLLVTEFSASVVAKNGSGQTPYDLATVNSVRQFLLPLQLQQETQQALDNGGVGLPPGIDMGGLQIRCNQSNIPPPPMANYLIPSTPVSAPPPTQFATPSPGIHSTQTQMLEPPTTETYATAATSVTPAPASATHAYARTGHSSAAIGAASRYRPDGFHSSSSDLSLAKKYGNANSGNAPVIPPPPSSGNKAPAVVSNPYTVAASSGSNPYARGGITKSRYLSYDGSALPTPPTSGTYNYYAPQPTTATSSYSGFTMFNPAGGVPVTVPMPSSSPYQQSYSEYNQGYQQAEPQYVQAYQQPTPQVGFEQVYQHTAQQHENHHTAPQGQEYDQGHFQHPIIHQGYDQQTSVLDTQQPITSPYQPPTSSAASTFLPPPPLSHLTKPSNSSESYLHEQPVAVSPYARYTLPGSSNDTFSTSSADVFSSPPSGGVLASAAQPPVPYQSDSTDYATPLKSDPAAVFAAPPSGSAPSLPPAGSIVQSQSTGSVQSAHDLFASGHSLDTNISAAHSKVDEPLTACPVERQDEQKVPETAAELFNSPSTVSAQQEQEQEDVAVIPEEGSAHLHRDSIAAEPKTAHDVSDDSMLDLQDVPLSESPAQGGRTPQPSTVTTAHDLFGLPPPPKMH